MRRSATAGTSSAHSTRWSGSASASTAPLLSSTANFERWLKLGGKDTASRASEIWQAKLDSFQPPPLDDAIRAELADYVTRRRRELGD